MIQLNTQQYELLGQVLSAELRRSGAELRAAPTTTPSERYKALRLIERAQLLDGLVNIFAAAAVTHLAIGKARARG